MFNETRSQIHSLHKEDEWFMLADLGPSILDVITEIADDLHLRC